MICPKCMKETLETSKFCPNCGYEFKNAAVMPVKKPTKKDNKNMKNSVTLIIMLLLVLGTFYVMVRHNNNSEPKDTQSKAASTVAATKNDNSSQNTKAKVSVQEVLEKIKSDYPDYVDGVDVVLMGQGVAKKEEIKGHDEVVGKYCYFFGYKGGNGCMFVADAEDATVYEVISQDPGGVLTLAKKGEVTTNNTDNNNSNAQTAQNAVHEGYGVKIANVAVGMYTSQYTNAGRVQFTLTNVSSSSIFLTNNDFIVKRDGENTIQSNKGDARDTYMYNSSVFDATSIELISGDTTKCNFDFDLPDGRDIRNYSLYYNQDGHLIKVCDLNLPLTINMN